MSVIGYFVEYRTYGNHTWKLANEDPVIDRNMQVGGLDEGTDYQFRVYTVNKLGKSRPKLLNTIVSTKRVAGSPPEVVAPLSDVRALTGEKCRFECEIASQPAADVEWFKGNQRLAPSKKYKFDTSGTVQALTIAGVTQADEGTYYCAARNQFGRKEVSAILTVESEPKFDETVRTWSSVKDALSTSRFPSSATLNHLSSGS